MKYTASIDLKAELETTFLYLEEKGSIDRCVLREKSIRKLLDTPTSSNLIFVPKSMKLYELKGEIREEINSKKSIRKATIKICLDSIKPNKKTTWTKVTIVITSNKISLKKIYPLSLIMLTMFFPKHVFASSELLHPRVESNGLSSFQPTTLNVSALAIIPVAIVLLTALAYSESTSIPTSIPTSTSHASQIIPIPVEFPKYHTLDIQPFGVVHRLPSSNCDKPTMELEFNVLANLTKIILVPIDDMQNNNYSCLDSFLNLAQNDNLDVFIKIELVRDQMNLDQNDEFNYSINNILNAVERNPNSISHIVIGQSTLYDNRISSEQLRDYIVSVKQKLHQYDIKVGTSEAPEIWLDDRNIGMFDVVDFIMITDFPSTRAVQQSNVNSEKTSTEDIFNLIINDYNNIKNKFLQKPVYLITGYVGDVSINLDYDNGVYNKILNLPVGKFTEDAYISNENKEIKLQNLINKLQHVSAKYFIHESFSREKVPRYSVLTYIPDENRCFSNMIMERFGNLERSTEFLKKLEKESMGCFNMKSNMHIFEYDNQGVDEVYSNKIDQNYNVIIKN